VSRITIWLTIALSVAAMGHYYNLSRSGDGKHIQTPASPAACTTPPTSTTQTAAPGTTTPPPHTPCPPAGGGGNPGESK
jgi:hypothetical protein